MWWLGCTGIWLKSEGGANICVDFWCGTGKQSHGNPLMKKATRCSVWPALKSSSRTCAPRLLCLILCHSPDRRRSLYPRSQRSYRRERGGSGNAKLRGRRTVYRAADLRGFVDWLGRAKERCIVMKPGDVVKIKDIEIHALDAFDRTALITLPADQKAAGVLPDGMDERAVNYLFKTPGGSLYHSGDSHYSTTTRSTVTSTRLTWRLALTVKTRAGSPTK